ncbi:Hpt domain-containing protein [Mangrovibacterium diazotrophicum]|uniref:HPt (Histidine-containing phosphotransfer) domain-containing protein n=1 Tax=Mangrovibacterium diazotrophicum TaxID=1261403 RepID=A0A419VYZ9_9BACT|nr:Hpt domain-containing protein [Mangrovibacterium diazotrophicum]RKD88465.1 HPt (histidine-containing phosphotransfer) domain-containing protein [Mangrovibacterium diazotrophicum]
MEDQKITSLAYLDEVTGGDPEITKEFIEMFFEQIVEFKTGLREYLSQKLYKELGELAHKAKSSVMTFGMNDLGMHLKQLQLKTQKLEEIDSYEDHVVEFETLIDQAQKELTEVLEKIEKETL